MILGKQVVLPCVYLVRERSIGYDENRYLVPDAVGDVLMPDDHQRFLDLVSRYLAEQMGLSYPTAQDHVLQSLGRYLVSKRAKILKRIERGRVRQRKKDVMARSLPSVLRPTVWSLLNLYRSCKIHYGLYNERRLAKRHRALVARIPGLSFTDEAVQEELRKIETVVRTHEAHQDYRLRARAEVAWSAAR